METLFALILALHLNKTDLLLIILISLCPFLNHHALTPITIIQALLLPIINHTKITHTIILKRVDVNIDILILILILLILQFQKFLWIWEEGDLEVKLILRLEVGTFVCVQRGVFGGK